MIEKMKRKRFPWVPVLASALAVALLGNTIFVIDSIERNRVCVPMGMVAARRPRVRLLGIDAPGVAVAWPMKQGQSLSS
jgi:hypothetical protein